MSLFGELDVESAEDDPFKVPANVYKAIVADVKVGPTKDQSKTGMTLLYKVLEGDHAGKTVREWKWLPTPADPKNPTAEEKQAMSFLKARMLDLGIPSDRVNTVERDDLLAKEVTITVKEGKNGFMNVNKVTLLQDDVVTTASGKKPKFS